MANRGGKRRVNPFKSNFSFNDVANGNMAPVPDAALPVPLKIAVSVEGVQFELEAGDLEHVASLGTGVHGTVDRMRHRRTGTVMAVKKIGWKLNSDQTTMLNRELDVSMRASRCPNVVKCYGAMYNEGYVWISMEVMDASLERFYQTVFAGGPEVRMPEEVIGAVASSVVNALHFLKTELEVIHRDVKPSNILINRNGVVKICDFGISGRLVDSIARSQVGSRNYMAPERVHSDGASGYDITSDVWSLGISIMELATGVFPYAAWSTPFDQLAQVVKGDPPRLSPGKFSPDLEDFVAKCLQKKSCDRPKYTDLLQHPFVKRHADADISAFVSRTLDRLAPINS